jgi:glutamate synthase domain-containing protein 2
VKVANTTRVTAPSVHRASNSWLRAEATRSQLFDARCTDGAVTRVVFATFTAVAHAAVTTLPSLPLSEVQPACEITRTFASGAMSHGALVARE